MDNLLELLQKDHTKDTLKKAIYTMFNILPNGSNLEPWMTELLQDKVNIKFIQDGLGVIINEKYEYSDLYYMYKDFRIPKEYTIKNNSLYRESNLIINPVLLITDVLYINGGKYPTYYHFTSTNGEFSSSCIDAGAKGRKYKEFQTYINSFVYFNSLKPKKIKIVKF